MWSGNLMPRNSAVNTLKRVSGWSMTTLLLAWAGTMIVCLKRNPISDLYRRLILRLYFWRTTVEDRPKPLKGQERLDALYLIKLGMFQAMLPKMGVVLEDPTLKGVGNGSK